MRAPAPDWAPADTALPAAGRSVRPRRHGPRDAWTFWPGSGLSGQDTARLACRARPELKALFLSGYATLREAGGGLAAEAGSRPPATLCHGGSMHWRWGPSRRILRSNTPKWGVLISSSG